MNRDSLTRRLGRILLGSGLAWMSVAACEDRSASEVRRWAQYWVERQHDTLASDSLTMSQPDSALLDSLAQSWSTEQWLDFWNEVDRAQGRKHEASDTVGSD